MCACADTSTTLPVDVHLPLFCLTLRCVSSTEPQSAAVSRTPTPSEEHTNLPVHHSYPVINDSISYLKCLSGSPAGRLVFSARFPLSSNNSMVHLGLFGSLIADWLFHACASLHATGAG